MKQNNNNRRARGRGPRKPHGMGGGHNKGQGFDNPGHETRVRGNAYQVLEKYLQLARDAGSAGDRVAAENYLQHADHYYRVLSAMNDGQRPRAGGRELSVADVNVQNVSQGLSAALSGGQGMPGMTDGNQGQGDGQEQEQGSGQDGGQDRRPDRGQQHGQGHGQSHGQNQGQNQNRHAQHVHQGQPRQGQGQSPGQNRGQQGQQADTGNAAGANGHDGGYGNYAEAGEQPSAAFVPAEPVRAAGNAGGDDQPDYPEELLPASAPAPATGAAPGEAAPEAEGRAPRGPRGRLRGQGRRGPRTPDSGNPDNVEPTE